ncbi:MAG: DUF4136 domain-containing protein [Alphaproteobacteria bacterium]|nr:DUF4136 domain-containing protein [Alphaproteobacteria bacterium]MBV9370456.1 DUF4136 domain-containing protein [Alphaproteobacteria bacterium]MBV9900034.1 DUF4136 domain-containing protein [Alphaproteobacteria bacterium]
MSLSKRLLTLAAPVALLALGGCATGFPAQVSRFQAMPAPQGQSFAIQAADPADRGGLEFAQYADLVRRHLTELGYTEAPSPQAATLVVSLDYGVDNGKQQVVDWGPSFGRYGGFGAYGGLGYRPFYSRFGYGRGFRSPFYWGWDDPFFFGGRDIDVYTVYTSFLDMDIKRTADGQSVFEGTAKARSRSDDLRVLVPNLVEAMFTGFPGNSGEQVRITVAPERPQPRR